MDHEVRVVVTNAGDGVGGVDVTFAAGTVTDGCGGVLEPDETCTVEVEHTAAIASASITAEPGDFSAFVRFGGACGGTASTCTIAISERSITLNVDVVFDLRVARIDFDPDPLAAAVGADRSVRAAAFADVEGDHPVSSATFTWETSNPGVATVRGETGGSATVSGIAAGTAWIRASTRNGRDSVRVVVGG